MARKDEKDVQSTATLLQNIRLGDPAAPELLCERYLPVLRRWAHGRLPANSRGVMETTDLVQITLMKALSNVENFGSTREGAFLAYMRTILLNSIRDELRKSSKNPLQQTFAEEEYLPLSSLVEQHVGREVIEKYERALLKLSQIQREAVILRIEFGFSFSEIAEAIQSASPNAARMMVSRALVDLAESMQ